MTWVYSALQGFAYTGPYDMGLTSAVGQKLVFKMSKISFISIMKI
jgi:hypothetical protein